MKDLAIVYVSKYGHTKQYADWLKESFDADVITAASFNPTKFLAYKATVFMSGVYSDKIQIMEWFKKNAASINPAKIIIAAVSWYTNDSEDGKDKLIKENYPDNFKNVVPLVVINSGIDKKQITTVEKARLAAASASINKHDVRSTDDINALAIIKGYSDQTSKDNLASLIKAVNKVLHPVKAPAKQTEAPKAAPAPAAAPKPTAPAAAEVQKAEVPKQEVQKPQPAQKAASTISSVDDALAALSSGNILLNRPPVNSAETEAAPTQAEEDSELKELEVSPAAEAPAAAAEPVHEDNLYDGIEIPEVPTLAEAVHKAEEAAKPAPEAAHEDNLYGGIEIPEVPTLAEAVHKAEETAKPAPEAAHEDNLYGGIEIPEVPTLAEAVHKAEEKHEEFPSEEDDIVLSVSDDIDEINRALETPKAPAAEMPKSEPVTFKRPEPVPVKTPTRSSSQRNSYLEFFSRKSNTPEPEPEPVPEPVKAETPAPAPVQDVHTIDDFDFDILGNESSTAGKVSSRALNAVEAHAKAKAAAEAEKAAAKAEKTASEENAPVTYETVSEPAEENIYTAPQSVPEETEEPEFRPQAQQTDTESNEESDIDDSLMFSNDADYDLDEIDASKLLEPEPAPKSESRPEGKRLDFKKLQEEIEASIEENKKIRDKEKYRNMRESERRAAEEELANPKKGIKQPDDPDIFFNRPGKDYYASDSMPEIRFNRHKQN
jgi:hypothetical protein